MSAAERQRLVQLITGLPQDITVLLIEHDIDLVFSVATHVAVLAASQLIADGRPDEIAASEQVQQAYLGASDTEEIFIS
jgi:branched-chain amino acid transport system ATP-binding protein